MATAKSHSLNQNHFQSTIECESGGNPIAVGDAGLSHGLVQIYAPAHPEITLEQANDPQFAVEWMAQEWDDGNWMAWTCWRDLHDKYGDGDWPE